MTILPGLCSVTFRRLSASEIVSACAASGLQAIEWGGDIHCPHGDLAAAKELRKMCADAGLETPSYGSYFRMDPECRVPDFREVLDSALTLGASTIRVWAGNRPSDEMDAGYRHRLVGEIQRIGALALEHGCLIGLEYHRHTAMDSNASARRLLDEVEHPAVKTYWQPREETSVEHRVEGLEMVLPELCHVHVFHWIGSPVERRPLVEAGGEWRDYLRTAGEAASEKMCAYLEFVRDDSLDAMKEDAAALLGFLRG